MSKCLELAVDILYHLSASRFKEALDAAEELVIVLRTYKESC
jgi:hypothetical protein